MKHLLFSPRRVKTVVISLTVEFCASSRIIHLSFQFIPRAKLTGNMDTRFSCSNLSGLQSNKSSSNLSKKGKLKNLNFSSAVPGKKPKLLSEDSTAERKYIMLSIVFILSN